MTLKAALLGAVLGFADLAAAPRNESSPVVLPAEYRVTVTTEPRFKKEEYESVLLLPPHQGRDIRIYCRPESEPWTKLPQGKAVTFTYWEVPNMFHGAPVTPDEIYWFAELDSIQDGETVIYEAAVCPLHHVRMERTDIGISYGLPMRDFMEAMNEKFYGGPGFVLGGCVVSEDSPKVTRGYRCVECVAACKKWGDDRDAARAQADRKR